LQRLFGETLPVPTDNLNILQGGETLELGPGRTGTGKSGRKLYVAYTPGHASHHVSYFDDANGVAFVGDTAGVRIEGGSFVLPATPPPDIDLSLWDGSFARILERRPARLFLTHYGYSNDPTAHIAEFRERLHRWAAVTAEILRTASDETAAMEAFVAKSRDEMERHLGPAEAEHHALTAGLNLSFLGLARYIRKQANAMPVIAADIGGEKARKPA
jgi:glyoxylase-like metal-dependent hydrolase (beta-lactamase superfamily II)